LRRGNPAARFGYDYDTSGRITTWERRLGGVDTTLGLSYNPSSELLDAVLKDSTNATLRSQSWRYDKSGNRMTSITDQAARTETRVGRGREAFLTDRERFSRDSREGIVKDMTAGAIDQAGLMNVQGRRALLEKGIKNQMEQVAPMLASFDEERQNARLQGPSRVALQMTDVSTSQGASELTRLLRGDDSAKDVNLAELRKQTAKFDDLIQAVRDANPGVLL
jgi:YD repeat-containing protein